MATIDRLDIQIEGSAQKANVAINDLIKNLDRLANSLKIDTSGLEKIGKSLNLSGIDKAAKNMQSQTQKVSKSLSQITEQYKDLGKGFEIKGSTQQIQKQIDSLTNKLANAKLAKDDFEASGKTNLGGYETAVKNVIKYTNQIESLKKQLEGLQTAQPKLDFNVAGAESQTKYLVEYKKQLIDFKNDMKSIGDVYGGLQNVPKGGLDTPIQNLKQSIEELKQSYPQATNVISAFEKELQKLQGISSGLTKEPIRANIDTSSIDKVSEKIAELKNRFEKVGSDFKFTGNFEQLNIEIEKVYSKLNELRTKEQEMISAGQVNTSGFEQLQESLARVGNKFGIMQDLRDRTEAFNQSLKQLRVPEIREENLTKLQNSLRKTEADTEKLRTKLSNAITMGKIIPNIDDSGFRKLTEQIALSEKQAEALSQKIQEVGGDTNGTGSIMDRLKSSLSNVSSQSNKTSSATNILSKNIKNLSSTMSGFSKSAGKAITGMKSFARQALSAMGIYLGVYGAVRGLKSSLESSMNYIEILNYFNAAFGQVAEKADYRKFEEMGYDSAESYYNSFAERAKELTEKMSGFTIKESGMLETGGMKSLGIDPSKLMNYQAMFGQMSSSMGVTSENALRLSTVLTEIGADLASVKNMKFEKVWNDMASGLAGMSRTLDKYGANIRNVNLQQKLNELGISANISALNQNDKALLRTIILLDSTRYAWGDLAKTINQPANQLRLLQSNFSNLGRSIGNIFLPIVAKVLPYINMLVQALTRLAEWLAKLLGFEGFDWGGGGGGNSTPDILGDIYDNAEDVSGALDKVSESAKKAKAGLRGFDELKTINMPESNEPDDGAGGAGAGGIDSGLLQGALDNILDEYQAAWDKAFSEMENRANTFADNVAKAFKEKGLYGVGEYFSESITSALESIPWDSIYEGARMFGKGLADFLNGLISPELFYSLGKTVAGAIGTVLHFLDSFADPENGFDFSNFGNSLATGIVGVLENIPWETALSAASNWGVGIAKALNAFISPETFGLIGESIAKALNVAVQFALDFGHEFKFENLGNSIAEGINRFFLEFKPEKLAETINVWIKGALTTVTALLQETDFEQIGKKIGTFLAELDFLEIAGKLATALWEAIKAGFELLGGLIQEAPLETALIAVFSFFKFTGIGKLISGNIATSITQSLATALGSISLPSLPVIAAIAAVAAVIIDLWNTSETFRDSVGLAFSMVKDSLVGAFEKIKDAVTPLWEKIKELGQAIYDFYEGSGIKKVVEILASLATVVAGIVTSAIFTVLGNMISGFATMVGGVIDTLTGIFDILTGIFTLDTEKIGEGFSKILEGIGGIFDGFLKQFGIDTKEIGKFFSSAWESAKKAWEKVTGWFTKYVIEPVKKVFYGLKTNISNAFSTAWGLVKGVWNAVSGWFNENIKTPITNTFNTVKGNIHNAFLKAKILVTTAWGVVNKWFIENIKTPITNTFSTIKENIHNAFKNAWNLVKGVWNAVSGWFKEHIATPIKKIFVGEDGEGGLKGAITGAFSDAYDGITKTFGAIGDFFKGIANGIIKPIGDAVNGIIKGINWVLGKVGSKTTIALWDVPQFATGSKGLPQDTIGIVNDQKGRTYKELIVPPHGKPFIPEGRNVMLPMKKGTKIMPARQTKDFMEKMNGMPHFAGGIGDFFKGAWSKITEFTGNIWDYISNPGKILQIAFDKFTDLSGILEPVLSIAKGAASTLLDGATGFIKKMFDENLTVQYNPSKGVEQWRGLATKALQITNQFTAPNLTALLTQMQHESSGNPRAINLWDANAKKGTPSKGLMQVIDPTFRAYALAPHNKDIWDPLSNMIAAIRYTVSHYGSLYSGWTARGYKGYASGIGKIKLADLIPQYKAGGFPEDGLFYANHNELVGKFSNGQTAVANNEQITEGISDAVQRGNRENNALMRQEISLLRTQNEILTGILHKEFGITKNDIGKAAQDYSREYLRTKGVPAYDF